MRRLVPVPVKSTYRVLARGKGTASWSPWKVGRRRRHRRRREKLQLEYNQLSLRCQLVLTLSYGQFCSCRGRRRFHPHRFGRTRVVVTLSLSPCCGGTARNRLPLLAWILSICTALRRSQAKTLAELVAAAVLVQRIRLANLGRVQVTTAGRLDRLMLVVVLAYWLLTG